MNIEITRFNSELSKRIWRFNFGAEYGDVFLVLDGYSLLERATKRHSWKAIEWYRRLDNRGSTLKYSGVQVPDDVIKEVKDQIITAIEFVDLKENYR